MTAQVSVWLPGDSKVAVTVELVKGDNAMPLDTLQPGDQRQFQTFPGCGIRVTETAPTKAPSTQETKT